MLYWYDIELKLEENYHAKMLNECKNEEAIKMENLRHVFKVKYINENAREEREMLK